jgi:putative DNA primase/helicase
MNESNAELDQKTIAIDAEHESTEAEIDRLAALSRLEYDRQRGNAAERLKIRTTTLDDLVKARKGITENGGTKGQGRPLSLPDIESWYEAVDGAELLTALSAAIRSHVVMEDGAADAIALWIVHTYALDSFSTSPRLAITSPEKQCGKTTLLDVLAPLVRRALPTVNVTSSVIFRVVEMAAPTLLIDEADTFLKDNDELRGILNSGHRRHSAAVVRNVGDNHEPRQFSTWAAVAIAMIGRLPDTLEDRSIPIRLQRRRPNEYIAQFRADRVGELMRLARMAARWVADNESNLRDADPEMPSELYNRTAENWRPLITIADAAGGDWPERARAVARASIANSDPAQSIRVGLLQDIKWILDGQPAEDGKAQLPPQEKIPSVDLAGALAGIEGRPWGEWGRTGKAITPNSLARLLASFSIHPENLRVSAGKVLKGYRRDHFEGFFDRYLSDGDSNRYTATMPINSGLSAVSQPLHPNNGSGLKNAENPHEIWSCSGVAVARAVCAQCGLDDGQQQRHDHNGRSVWLHPECVRCWKAA